MLASLMGFLGDFELAEEATADAFATAAERWPVHGTPPNPGGWLTTTAKRRAIDLMRRRRTLAEKTRQLEIAEGSEDNVDEIENPRTVIADERLELIFMCCHPALSKEAQVALTLRALGGLSTEEIARAFLVGEETMKRRLSRAKAKIRATRIPFAVPADSLLPDRLASVLAVIYLIYNEGFVGGRVDLAAEAIRLGELLAAFMPDEPEAHGLLALMLLQHARRAARFDSCGDLVLLSDQDRSLWDVEMIAAGRKQLDRAIGLRGRGTYVLQAAIDSVQIAPDPDWHELSDLYARLVQLTGSPVVKLNHAVAIAQAGDAQRALAIVDGLDLAGYPYLHSTRGELLARLGRAAEAKAAFAAALERVSGEPERRFLQRRIKQL